LYPWLATVKSKHHEEENATTHHHHHDEEYVRRHQLKEYVNTVDLKLRRLVHQSISDLIDPSRVYTSTMLLSALLGSDSAPGLQKAAKKSKGVLANEGRGKFYRTSAAIMALLGDSNSYQARKFLHRGGGLYVSVPGIKPHFDDRKVETQPSTAKDILNKVLGTDTAKNTEKSLQKQKSIKPLDFSHLFENQPDANYFPQPSHSSSLSSNNNLTHYTSNSTAFRRISNMNPSSRSPSPVIRKPTHLQPIDQHSLSADSITMNSDSMIHSNSNPEVSFISN
jgi:hypothetical protein